MIIQPPVALLPSGRPFTPQLFTKVFANERMCVELPGDCADPPPREVSLFLVWQESLATRRTQVS